jgi:hypothetical protein
MIYYVSNKKNVIKKIDVDENDKIKDVLNKAKDILNLNIFSKYKVLNNRGDVLPMGAAIKNMPVREIENIIFYLEKK